jgi:hypothetical protein
LKSFPLRKLSFIGVAEYSSFEIPYLFERVLGCSFDGDVGVLNATRQSQERSIAAAQMGSSFVRAFRAANKADYRLYEMALKIHDQRRNER